MSRLSLPLLLLSLLWLLSCAVAEPLPVTLWQKEKRTQVQPGQTVRLQRGPFTMIAPLEGKEDIAMVAAAGPRPAKILAFDPGFAMAGPYDGLYLTWEGSHYFFVDETNGDKRMSLWDPKRGLFYWKATRLFDNTGHQAEAMDWDLAPPLTFIFRKKGFDDLNFQVIWVD